MTVPVATNADGSPIVGRSLEEFVIDRPDVSPAALTYPAATRDKSEAHLTMRAVYADTPRPVPETGWEYIDDRRIRLVPEGTAFQPGSLYEFTYPAKNPRVAGLAFAGLRDLTEFLHYGTVDDQNRPNPLAGDVRAVYAFGRSQPARFIHDFLHLGFNADSANRRVFDGVLSWIGGASGGFFNYRFAQPGRTHRQHIGRWYPERQFPFTNRVINDPVTGLTDGRLSRCLQNGTCPKIFEVNSENEYLGQGGLTPAHRHERAGSGGSAERPPLPSREPAARSGRGLRISRHLPAAAESVERQRLSARAPREPRRLGDASQRAARQPRAARRQWHPCPAAAPVGRRVSIDPRHRLQRPTARGRPLRLRGFVRHGCVERRAASPRRRAVSGARPEN